RRGPSRRRARRRTLLRSARAPGAPVQPVRAAGGSRALRVAPNPVREGRRARSGRSGGGRQPKDEEGERVRLGLGSDPTGGGARHAADARRGSGGLAGGRPRAGASPPPPRG